MFEMHVLTGDDGPTIRARRDELLDGHTDIERIDVAEAGSVPLLHAVTSPGLFTPRRIVDVTHLDELDAAVAHQIADAAAHADALVVARTAGALPAAVRKALKPVATITSHSLPRGRQLVSHIAGAAKRHDITLPARGAERLAERAGHDPNRVETIFVQLSAAGLHRPELRQLDLLLGTINPPGVPWTLSDAVEAGDVPTVIGVAHTIEPLAAIGYLAKRHIDIGQLVDRGTTDTTTAAEQLGLKHDFQARQLLAAARRLGRDGVAEALVTLARADQAIKHARPDERPAVYEAALVTLTRLHRQH